MSAVMAWELSSSKIKAQHRDRLAVVYVRQSTPDQVQNHPESTRLQALTPAAIAASLHAIAQVHTERQRLEQLWKLRLERAQISVDHARRCYQAVEPENRLVARQLETGWQQALHEQRALIEDHDRFQQTTPTTLTPAQQQAITTAAADLPDLWHAATTTDTDRKQIIRAVLDESPCSPVAEPNSSISP